MNMKVTVQLIKLRWFNVAGIRVGMGWTYTGWYGLIQCIYTISTS